MRELVNVLMAYLLVGIPAALYVDLKYTTYQRRQRWQRVQSTVSDWT